LDFRILGPLEVADNGSPVALGRGRQRALLALLLVHANEVVSNDRLIDELWGERPPPTAQTGLHGYVSQLRKLLGSERVETRGSGYLLRVEEGEIDREQFESLARAGRFADALAVWRGPALADFAYESWAQAEIGRLDELRLACLAGRIDSDLDAGREAELVGELEALVAAHPLRERFRAQLMLALYRSGRQADALDAYRAARQRFVEELGIEPGEELQELHKRILAHDPALSPVRSPRRKPPPGVLTEAGQRRGWRGRRWLVGLAALAIAVAAVAVVAAISLDREDPPPVVLPNSVAKIDPKTNEIVSTVPVGRGAVALAAVGRNLWVANRTDDTLTRVDTRTHETRTFGGFAFPISLAAQGPRVWVGSESSNEVVAIDGEIGSVLQRLPVDPGPAGFVSVGEGSLWVSHGVFFPGLRPEAPSAFSRVDVLARAVDTRRLRDGDSASWIAVGGGAAWISLTGPGQLLRIDALDGAQRRINVGSGPLGLAVGFGDVWVTSTSDDAVRRVNAATGTVEDVIEVEDQPLAVAVGAGSVWIANHRDRSISRIDPATGEIVATIRMNLFPTAVHVAAGAVWVTSSTEPAFDGSQVLG
jgi:DNA-binding SARP family transcriptional activator/DNA-binding beta-propeller fold protein YncE